MKNNNLTFGKEIEACIVDHNGEILPSIGNESSFEFIENILQERFSQRIDDLVKRISPEELGHQIEIKNPVPFSDIEIGTEQIIGDLRMINEIEEIRKYMQLILTPVSKNNFEAIPSIGDKEAHQRKLFDSMIDKFGPEEGLKIVKSFATFSDQTNIGGLFDGLEGSITDEQFQELSRRFLNIITEMKDLLLSQNGKVVNWEGKTRQDIANDVLTKLKGGNFEDKKQILIPPHFSTRQEMLNWIGKHNGIKKNIDGLNIGQLGEKDMHSFLAKIKWESFPGVEIRAIDASPDFESSTSVTNKIVEKLLEIREEFLEEIKLKVAA